MNKALLIFTHTSERFDNIAKAFSEKVKDTEITTTYGYSSTEIYEDRDGKLVVTIGGYDPADFDVVINYNVRKSPKSYDIASLIAFYCESKDVRLINRMELHNFTAGKVLQKLLFKINGLHSPRFYFSGDDKNHNYEWISSILGDKFVAKQAKSELGRKVILIENADQLAKLSDQIKHNIDEDGLWHFEEFVPHEKSTRGFVTGEKCDARIDVLKEEESFRTNEGKATFAQNIDQELTEMCIKAAKLFKLEIAGVDTIVDNRTGELMILEANKSPGITIDPEPSIECDVIAALIDGR